MTQRMYTTGLFKGKERKALQEKIEGVQQEIDRRMDKLPGILKEDGYPDVQTFKRTYDAATGLVEQLTVIWPHGNGRSTESSPSRHRLKKRASERNSGIWKRRPSAGTMLGGSRHGLAAIIMTEDAKTENTPQEAPAVRT